MIMPDAAASYHKREEQYVTSEESQRTLLLAQTNHSERLMKDKHSYASNKHIPIVADCYLISCENVIR
jgi:hypothetical protein